MDKDRQEELKRMASELEAAGYGVIHPTQFRIDMEKEFLHLWSKVEPYTMTSVERGYALYTAVRYVETRGIHGSFVECGVWRGGSCMLAALTLLQLDITDRDIYLYDTYTGMPEPGVYDRVAWNNTSLRERGIEDLSSWSVGMDEVAENLRQTGYPLERIHLIPGKVEETLLDPPRGEIALLRLDTDWYESTAVELDILYPRLQPGGVLLIDDYGHFTGARKAVDDYFAKGKENMFLARVDYTGRVGVKG